MPAVSGCRYIMAASSIARRVTVDVVTVDIDVFIFCLIHVFLPVPALP